MDDYTDRAKALFLSADGTAYPDSLICTGILPPELGGKQCPFSKKGRMPDPIPLETNNPTYTLDKGKPGDLCPPCVKQQLGCLGDWQGHKGQHFPQQLLPLRLFKCRQWFWLVVPGLYHEEPTVISSHHNFKDLSSQEDL